MKGATTTTPADIKRTLRATQQGERLEKSQMKLEKKLEVYEAKRARNANQPT